MTKKQLYILIPIVVILILALTNPSEESHIQNVKSKLKTAFKKKNEAKLAENTEKSSLGDGIGSLLGEVFIEKMVDRLVSRGNYILFSTTKANYKGQEKIIGFGILGNVFISGKIKDVFNKDKQETKEPEKEEIKESEREDVKEPETQAESEKEEIKKDLVLSKEWKTFNHKYGYSIELPAEFEEGLLTASAIQYYGIKGELGDFNIMVETLGEGTRESLKESFKMNSENPNVSYKALQDTWFVTSGTDGEDGIFYSKTIIKNNQTHSLDIRYKTRVKNKVEPLIGRIANSLK